MRSFCKSIGLLLVCGVFGAVTDKEVPVSVTEGESVTLLTNVTKLLNDDKILWRFGEGGKVTLITEMSGDGTITYKDLADGRFKDRLQILDLQTGDLIIKNIKHKHSGRYNVDHETNTGTTYKKFRVTVRDAPQVIGAEQSDVKSARAIEGDSVRLNNDLLTQNSDLILWRFGDEGVLLAKGDKEDNKSSIYDDVLDGMFRDRLKMEDQTGSLIITNIKTTDTGVYKLKIINNRDTKYKTFSLFVSERGLSAGQVTGIICCVLLLVIAVAGVIMYRRIKYEQQKQKVIMMMVPERVSVTLETHVTKPQSDDVIELSLRDDGTATFNTISSHDVRFRYRLKMDNQTGSLTITNIRTEDAGLYKVKISSSSGLKSFIQFITGGGPSYYQFNVIVKEGIKSVMSGGSVTLKTGFTGIQIDDEIQWTFTDETTPIVEITVGTEPSYVSSDERFSDRLMMDPWTGDLTISNITTELTGVYKVQIISSSRGSEERDYRVVVSVIAFTEESVTLHTDSKIQSDSEIKWISDDETILVTGKSGDDKETKYTDDERYRDRLEMNHKTGDLTITKIRKTDDGLYILQEINSDKISCRIVSVNVRERMKSAKSGGSVTLKTSVTGIQRDNVIQWTFGDEKTLIAEMTVGTEPLFESPDERFTHKLMMDSWTGDLTISNITSELYGVYRAKIISSRGTEYRKYRVIISARRPTNQMKLKSGTEGNETTTVVMPLLNEAEDRF